MKNVFRIFNFIIKFSLILFLLIFEKVINKYTNTLVYSSAISTIFIEIYYSRRRSQERGKRTYFFVLFGTSSYFLVLLRTFWYFCVLLKYRNTCAFHLGLLSYRIYHPYMIYIIFCTLVSLYFSY